MISIQRDNKWKWAGLQNSAPPTVKSMKQYNVVFFLNQAPCTRVQALHVSVSDEFDPATLPQPWGDFLGQSVFPLLGSLDFRVHQRSLCDQPQSCNFLGPRAPVLTFALAFFFLLLQERYSKEGTHHIVWWGPQRRVHLHLIPSGSLKPHNHQPLGSTSPLSLAYLSTLKTFKTTGLGFQELSAVWSSLFLGLITSVCTWRHFYLVEITSVIPFIYKFWVPWGRCSRQDQESLLTFSYRTQSPAVSKERPLRKPCFLRSVSSPSQSWVRVAFSGCLQLPDIDLSPPRDILNLEAYSPQQIPPPLWIWPPGIQ